jgi:HPt (histidine-containing phosphotransfer) domain-containing protein
MGDVGLDEIEATLASFETHLDKPADDHTEAAGLVADMCAARDAFRKSIEEKSVEDHRQMNELAFRRWKTDLEGEWAAFEDSLQTYLEKLRKQVTEQETVFRARACAQSRAWQQAVDWLHKRAASLGANQRGDVEAAARRLEWEADAQKAKLDKLNRAEGASGRP